MLRNIAVISALLVLWGAQSGQCWAQTVSSLDSDVRALIGDSIKLTGPVTMAKPDEMLKVNDFSRLGKVFSVPVAFARTARLDNEVHATTGEKWGWDNDVVIPAGTMLYHATFRRLATHAAPLEAWCADHSYVRGVFHDKTSHRMYCIARDKNGKAIGFYGGASQWFNINGWDEYPSEPQWFAFSLSGAHSLPFDYPSITETNLPSPPMTLSLNVEEDGKTFGAYLTLTGLSGGDPAYGDVWRLPIIAKDDQFKVIVGQHTVSMNYVAGAKSVTNVRLDEGMPSYDEVGLPLYYWLGYQVANKAQPAEALEDTPWQFGAEHVNPDTLVVASGALAKKDKLLSASGQLGLRYRLTSPLLPFRFNAGAPAGSEAYQASETNRAPDGTLYRNDYWCVKLPSSAVECVPASLNQIPGGQGRAAWQVSPASLDIYEGVNVRPYQPEHLNVSFRPIDAVADPDPNATIDTIEMRVADIQDGYVAVTLGVGDGDSFHAARTFTLPFDAKGDATLSLWTRQIQLHHDGKTVLVTGTDPTTGDGPQIDASHVFEVAK